MGFGVTIKNLVGTVIIDSQYTNLYWDLKNKSMGYNQGGEIGQTFNETGTTILPVCRPKNIGGACAPSCLDKNGTTGKFYRNWFYAYRFQSGTIEYRHYKATQPISGSKIGLRIYDSKGSVNFNSNIKSYLKINKAVPNIILSNPSDTDEAANTFLDIQHYDVVNPFYFISPHASWDYASGGKRYYWRILAKKLSGTSVRVKWGIIGTQTWVGAINAGWNPTFKLIIITP